ncbi:transcription factor bHLH147 [Typha latifolia]|uniref:transcription factor bHLH147 n=1 Tax=Typha latifolia TaxID=4733 RepID=UPI003C2C9351
MVISTSDGGDSAAKGGERKRKRIDGARPPSSSKWRMETEQKTYSSKLLEALRRVRRSQPPGTSPSRAIRDAADRALAAAGRGRTRWSRAILSNRPIRLRSAKRRLSARKPPSATITAAPPPPSPEIERKARVLGRLVPGCRKLSLPTLLSEASDYIPALEMQVRAMTALAEILCSVAPAPTPDRTGLTQPI